MTAKKAKPVEPMPRLTVSVDQFGPIERGHFEIGTVALVQSVENRAGKTRLLTGAASALTGTGKVFGGLVRDAGKVVRRGHDIATVTLELEGRETVMAWPGGRKQGDRPWASEFCAGLVDIAGPRVTPDYLFDLIGQIVGYEEPGDDAIRAELTEAGADVQKDMKSWINHGRSWKKMEDLKRGSAKDASARWTARTRDNWGPKKADGWIPKGFTDRARDMPVKDLEAAITAAKDLLIQAKADQIVEGIEADQLAEAHQAHGQAEQRLAGLSEALQPLLDDRATIPPVIEPHTMVTCASCGAVGAVEDLRLVEVKVDRGVMESRRQRLALLDKEIERLQMERSAQETTRLTAKITIDKSLKSARTAAGQIGTQVDQSDLEARIDALEADLKMKNTKIAADLAYLEYVGHTKLADLFSPQGMRAVALADALERYALVWDSMTKKLWGRADAFRIEIGDDGKPQLLVEGVSLADGAAFNNDASSARLLCQAQLQIMLAMRDGSDLIVVDQADRLTKRRLGVLILTAARARVRLLVARTITRPEKRPVDMLARVDGDTLGIVDGVVMPFAEAWDQTGESSDG